MKKLMIFILLVVTCLSGCGQENGSEALPNDVEIREDVFEEEEKEYLVAIDENNILVEFDGTLVESDTPISVYSTMFTRTFESYYDIVPGTTFTVTNRGEDDGSYVLINVTEYIRSEESFEIEVNHDGEHKWMDMQGEFWNDDKILYLNNESFENAVAGENLYWKMIDMFGEQSQYVKIYTGESVTFHMPEHEQDVVYFVNARYQNGLEGNEILSNNFWIAACNVIKTSN